MKLHKKTLKYFSWDKDINDIKSNCSPKKSTTQRFVLHEIRLSKHFLSEGRIETLYTKKYYKHHRKGKRNNLLFHKKRH